MRTWTEEMRSAASERMAALWTDPAVRESRRLSARVPGACPDCGESDLKNFYLDKRGNRANSRCKECHKIACRLRWHSKSAIEKQATRVHAMYGITPQELLRLYEAQGGRCAICHQPPKTVRGLHVDHCHKTNRVRGLLCHGCNTGIGALREVPDVLLSAIKYLGA